MVVPAGCGMWTGDPGAAAGRQRAAVAWQGQLPRPARMSVWTRRTPAVMGHGLTHHAPTRNSSTGQR